MPSNLLNVDTAFPDLRGIRSTDEKFRMVSDYLYMLREQLQYSMANLGRENFNDSSFDDIAHIINEPVYVRLEDTDGKLSSLIQTVDGFDLRVENGETSSVIRLMSGRAEISSQVIRMNGLVTFTGLAEGTTIIDGGCIQTGTIDAQRLNLSGSITFEDLTGTVQNQITSAQDTADSALALAAANQLPGYIKSTYIDSTEIRSPTIKANIFSVYPSQDGDGGFRLYGQYNGGVYNALEINYFSGDVPTVHFLSPAHAITYWDFDVSYFSGTIDFSSASVTGLHLRFS